jgi:hypothetical protein
VSFHASVLLLLGAALTGEPIRAPVRETAGPRPAVIPRGQAALADGRLEPGEWTDARELAAAPDARLYLKHDDQFLAEYLNLHASAKLGERRGRGGAWPEWVWWNNEGWAANLTRAESFEARRFLPDTVKEFQIRLRRLPGREFALSLDLETADGAMPLLPDAPERDGLHWLHFRL